MQDPARCSKFGFSAVRSSAGKRRPDLDGTNGKNTKVGLSTSLECQRHNINDQGHVSFFFYLFCPFRS